MIKLKLDKKNQIFVGVGASVVANCQPCIKYHLKLAKDFGVSNEEINEAIKYAKGVKINASKLMDGYIKEILSSELTEEACCPLNQELKNEACCIDNKQSEKKKVSKLDSCCA